MLQGSVTLFERACYLRGHDKLLMDMAADEEFFSALLDRIQRLVIPCVRALLDEVGRWSDVLITGDNLGMTDRLMMSPKSYRRLIKPRHAELLAAIKPRLAGKVFFHSCGDVCSVLGDLIEVGVDLLNPVQVGAAGLADTARLKREFGDRLWFCGAIDTRSVLPNGTAEDVRAEVRRRHSRSGPRRRLRGRRGPLHPARRAPGKHRGDVRCSADLRAVPSVNRTCRVPSRSATSFRMSRSIVRRSNGGGSKAFSALSACLAIGFFFLAIRRVLSAEHQRPHSTIGRAERTRAPTSVA